MSADGLITVPSRHGHKATMDLLVAAVADRGMTVMARIDHGAAATKAGLELRPTEVLIFGNAKAGTPLMQVSQTLGIDLPLRMLVWEDAAERVWLTYNDPTWLAQRHGGGVGLDGTLSAMTDTLAALAKAAT